VLHNTALTSGRYPNAIEVRFAGATGVVVMNNLLDAAIQPRDGAMPSLLDNLDNAATAWFVDVALGDLHLTALATPAIAQATAPLDAADDFDGQFWPTTADDADIGADQSSANRIFATGFD
jgi:hypothetical protein